MILGVLAKVLAPVGVVGVLVFELASPSFARSEARHDAASAASAGAHELLVHPDPARARTAAADDTRRHGATLTTFHIDEHEMVHVTVARTARSLVARHIPSLRHYDAVTASAIAGPR